MQLGTLQEIIDWAQRKGSDEVGITSLDLEYPLACYHNERDGLFRKWSFTECYAENDSGQYPYPPDLQEVVQLIDRRHPEAVITARQLLAILIEVQTYYMKPEISFVPLKGTRLKQVKDTLAIIHTLSDEDLTEQFRATWKFFYNTFTCGMFKQCEGDHVTELQVQLIVYDRVCVKRGITFTTVREQIGDAMVPDMLFLLKEGYLEKCMKSKICTS